MIVHKLELRVGEKDAGALIFTHSVREVRSASVRIPNSNLLLKTMNALRSVGANVAPGFSAGTEPA
jgi:hypothetical protein